MVHPTHERYDRQRIGCLKKESNVLFHRHFLISWNIFDFFPFTSFDLSTIEKGKRLKQRKKKAAYKNCNPLN